MPKPAGLALCYVMLDCAVFYECMNISYDNFKYFADNQSGKCKFLNVIQGNNVEEYEAWYQKMKDFEFNGWCIGGAQKRVTMFMSALVPMIKNREFEKARNQFIHVLGISKISDFRISFLFPPQTPLRP